MNQKEKGRRKKYLFGWILLTVMLLFGVNVQAAESNDSSAGICTVNFYNNSGTGSPLKTIQTEVGTVIRLPDIPNSRYVNFGWTTTARSSSVRR